MSEKDVCRIQYLKLRIHNHLFLNMKYTFHINLRNENKI